MTNNEILSGAANSIRANRRNAIALRQEEILANEVYPKIEENKRRYNERYAAEKAEFDERRAREQTEFTERRAREQAEFDARRAQEKTEFDGSWEVVKTKMEADNETLVAEGKSRAECEINLQYDTILSSLEKLIEG